MERILIIIVQHRHRNAMVPRIFSSLGMATGIGFPKMDFDRPNSCITLCRAEQERLIRSERWPRICVYRESVIFSATQQLLKPKRLLEQWKPASSDSFMALGVRNTSSCSLSLFK